MVSFAMILPCLALAGCREPCEALAEVCETCPNTDQGALARVSCESLVETEDDDACDKALEDGRYDEYGCDD